MVTSNLVAKHRALNSSELVDVTNPSCVPPYYPQLVNSGFPPRCNTQIRSIISFSCLLGFEVRRSLNICKSITLKSCSLILNFLRLHSLRTEWYIYTNVQWCSGSGGVRHDVCYHKWEQTFRPRYRTSKLLDIDSFRVCFLGFDPTRTNIVDSYPNWYILTLL